MTATDIQIPALPDTFVPSTELFQRCLERGDDYRALRDTVESRRGDTWDADRKRAAQALLEANMEFDFAQKIERFVHDAEIRKAEAEMRELDEKLRKEGRLSGPSAAFAPLGGDMRTAGAQFVESDGYAGKGGTDDIRNMEVEVRNLLTGTTIGASGSNLFVPVGSPSLAGGTARRQRVFLRDLLSVQSTGLASVPYIREVSPGSYEGGASAVSEASAKPEVTMLFEPADAPIRKLAAWIQATEEALMDAPTLRGYIDTRLGYMLEIREDYEVINGNGTAPHIKGILNYTGGTTNIQTQALGGDLFAAIGSAIGKVENVDGDADGVAVNPLDFWAAVVDRQSTWFDGNVSNVGNAPFGVPSPTIWGLPVARTRSLASGTSIVGAFGLGATLFEREGVTIRTTDSHASLFISNTWVVLAEERIGLAVHRPDWFVSIS